MIVAVTGGRNRPPTLAELEASVTGDRGPIVATVLYDGKGGLCDHVVSGFVEDRGLARVERFPADWIKGKSAGPIRNRCMLDGDRGELVKLPPVERLLAFKGGRGTRDCMKAAEERGIPVIEVEPVVEPIPWNRHWPWSSTWGPKPRQIYVGGNDRDPSMGSPLANPFRLGRGGVADPLAAYRKWLWSKLAGPDRDPAVLAALEAILPTDAVVCSCWPRRCHAEIIVRAWRWVHGIG